MGVDFKITSIQTVKNTLGFLYVDVEFLDAGRVFHREDFVMQISPTVRRYTGPELAEGETPEPKDYVEEAVDVKAAIIENITRYVKSSAFGRGGDTRDPNIFRDDTDPLGLKATPGVAALIGAVQAVEDQAVA